MNPAEPANAPDKGDPRGKTQIDRANVPTKGPAPCGQGRIMPATRRAFASSRAKTGALTAKLAHEVPPEALASLHASAGPDLGAITPEELALSLMAQMVGHRRQGQRENHVLTPCKPAPIDHIIGHHRYDSARTDDRRSHAPD